MRAGVAFEVADSGIELGESDFHGEAAKGKAKAESKASARTAPEAGAIRAAQVAAARRSLCHG